MTWCSEVSTSPGLRLASSAIHRRFVDRFAELMSLPVFPVDGSLLATPPFPRSGPGEPGSPLSAVLRRRYDFPCAHQRSLICFASAAHGYLLLRVRRSAPASSEEILQARALVPAARRSGSSYVDAHGTSQVFRRSFPRLCSVPRPRSSQRVLASTGYIDAAPLPIQRRPRRYLISGLTCSFSTRSPYASGVALPPHPQGSLPAGGLRLCREGFEPSGSLRKVSVRWFDDHPPFLLS